MYFARKVMLAKIETTYGTDSTPTASANACLFQDVDWTPMEGDQVAIPRALPWMGNDPIGVVAQRARLRGSVDLANSGTAGTAPAWGVLARACGLAEFIVASTSVTYKPVSTGFESASLYGNMDGVQHKALGARGDMTIEIAAKQVPKLRFDLQGLFAALSAVALPAPTLTSWKDAKPVSFANTGTTTVNGVAVAMTAFQASLGNQMAVRDLPQRKAIVLTERAPSASITFEAPDALATDFISTLVGTKVPIVITHDTGAGVTWTVSVPNFRVLPNPTYSNDNGIVLLTLNGRPEPGSSGNDEISIAMN